MQHNPIMDFGWRWQNFGSEPMLVTDGGGAKVVLATSARSKDAPMVTREPAEGRLVPIKPDSDVALLLAAAPNLARELMAAKAVIARAWAVLDAEADQREEVGSIMSDYAGEAREAADMLQAADRSIERTLNECGWTQRAECAKQGANEEG